MLSESCKIDKFPISGGIQCFYPKKMNAIEILVKIQQTLINDASWKTTTCFWVSRFKRSDMNDKDEGRSWSLKQLTTPEMVKTVYDVVLCDQRVKMEETVKPVDMSIELCMAN